MSQFRDDLETGHVRHHHVQQNHVGEVAGRQFQTLGAVGGEEYLITVGDQHGFRGDSNGDFVVNHQYDRFFCVHYRLPLGSTLCVLGWENKFERAPLTGAVTLHPELAPMHLDQTPGDAQSQAQSGGLILKTALHLEEIVENPGLVFRRDADPGITDFDGRRFVLRPGLEGDRATAGGDYAGEQLQRGLSAARMDKYPVTIAPTNAIIATIIAAAGCESFFSLFDSVLFFFFSRIIAMYGNLF